MAKFYGQFMVDSFKRQMKENRKIEELILMFATHATGVLKKEPSLGGEGWKLELNSQIALFVKLLRECLRNVNHVSPELLSRLDTYTAKLAPSRAQSDSGYDSASTSRDRDSVSTPAINSSIADMHLVMTVAHLFKIPDHTIQKEVDQLKGQTVTEKARPQFRTRDLQADIITLGRFNRSESAVLSYFYVYFLLTRGRSRHV